MDALVADLRRRLGERAVVTDADVLASHSHDSASFCEAGTPAALVRPGSTEEVRQAVLVAREHRVPLVTQGARTGLSGGANAIDGCVLLSTERMDRILELDVDDQVAVVQPGVVNAELSRAVAEHGLFYPPDPSSWEESHDRRQRGHQRRRPVLREVRRHRATSCAALEVVLGTGRGAAHRPAHRQGRRGLRPDPAGRRLRGHARRRHRGHAGAASRRPSPR